MQHRLRYRSPAGGFSVQSSAHRSTLRFHPIEATSAAHRVARPFSVVPQSVKSPARTAVTRVCIRLWKPNEPGIGPSPRVPNCVVNVSPVRFRPFGRRRCDLQADQRTSCRTKPHDGSRLWNIGGSTRFPGKRESSRGSSPRLAPCECSLCVFRPNREFVAPQLVAPSRVHNRSSHSSTAALAGGFTDCGTAQLARAVSWSALVRPNWISSVVEDWSCIRHDDRTTLARTGRDPGDQTCGAGLGREQRVHNRGLPHRRPETGFKSVSPVFSIFRGGASGLTERPKRSEGSE